MNPVLNFILFAVGVVVLIFFVRFLILVPDMLGKIAKSLEEKQQPKQ